MPISEITALHLLNEKYIPSEEVMEILEQYRYEGLWMNDEVISLGD